MTIEETRAQRKQRTKQPAPVMRKSTGAEKPASKKPISSTGGRKSSAAPEKKAEVVVMPSAVWGWADALIVACVLAIAVMVSGSVMQSALTQLLPSVGKATARTTLLLFFYGIEVIALVYLAHKHHATFWRAHRLVGDGERPTLAQSALISLEVVGLLIACRGLSMGWTYITKQFGWTPDRGSDVLALFGSSPLGVTIALITVGLVAPFIEELVFRGVVFGAVRRHLSVLFSVLAVSLLFGLYHGSFWMAVPTFILGCATGWLSVRHKTLWPAIALHVLYNATLLAAALYLA